jgi:hypothetical protein
MTKEPKTERRKYPRMFLGFVESKDSACYVSINSEQEDIVVFLQDLSRGGARLQLHDKKYPVKENDTITFTDFKLDVFRDLFPDNFCGKVRWVDKEKKVFGIQFEDLLPQHLFELKHLLSS